MMPMRRIYLVGAVVLSIILVASGLWFLWSRNIILPDHRVEVAYIGTGIRVTWIADRPGTILWVKGAANPRCAPPRGTVSTSRRHTCCHTGSWYAPG